ncbi:transposase [Escherichia coli]|nr:transposase [Escherichia coli]
MTFQNHTNCPLTDLGGKTSIFSHPVYLFLREFSLQDFRGGSINHFALADGD